MKIFVVILAAASIASAFSVHDPNYCYANDFLRTQRPRWSDRTSNDFVRGTNQVNPNVSSCTPAKFWLYMRHGDRLPSVNDINRMIPFSQTVSKNNFHSENLLKKTNFFRISSNEPTLSTHILVVEATCALPISTQSIIGIGIQTLP